ncbi:porin [Candidatus Parabeggiatoa sp. HSG14]|uniref:OprO/OprP family phosphate-selective porin n=1 Tax=Candidatus Parabeggiatoa sp. HSG14 TaxID=3055593 RepID=UPI0025A72574|nr:porin [Thiotrichales bacterium HSG14]
MKVFVKQFSTMAICLSIFFIPHVFADVQIGAKLLVDHNYYNGVHHKSGKSGSDNEIRLLRVYLKSKFDKHWEGMLQTQISEHEGSTKTVWKEVFLKYNGLGPFDITMGKRKEPFGLQMLVNAERVLFMERAMISSSFAPERSIGLTLFTAPGISSFEMGIYSQGSNGNSAFSKGSPEADNSEKDTYAITGRVTLTPMQKGHSLIHLGLAGSYRDFGGNEYQVKDRAEVHLAQPIVISGKTVTDKITLLGVEAAAQFGPFSIQSEYMQASISAEEGSNDAKYDGYYVQLGYLLTGGFRDYKKGKFGEVKPSSNYGAWQLMGRYSVLNAEDNNEGVEAENIAFGLNWFANTSVRISANYIMTQLDNANPNNDDGDAFLLRFQYVF